MTFEELENYVPGTGCECHAYNESECGCGVDWTPKEVYALRLEVEQLKNVMRKACNCLTMLGTVPSLEMKELCGWSSTKVREDDSWIGTAGDELTEALEKKGLQP